MACSRGGAGTVKKITASDLMAALEGKYEDKKHGLIGRREIIRHIVHVRTNMEQFNEGGLQGRTSHSLMRISR